MIGVLGSAGVASAVLRVGLGHDFVFGLVPLFRLDRESNVPTWYSSMALALAATLLALVAGAKRRRGEWGVGYWVALATIFTLLSLDESAQLHELAGLWIHERFHTSGVFFLAWTLPVGMLVLAAGAGFLRFVVRLPRRTAVRFVIAGALYVGAALGFELIESPIEERFGQDNVATAVLTCIEETSEMLAIALFIGAILEYAATEVGVLRLRLRAS